MRYYPLLLDLQQQNCLVIGAGEVGQRKIMTLVDCAPRQLTVIDPRPVPEPLVLLLQKHAFLRYIQRKFRTEDLHDVHLVFACTTDHKLNSSLSADCARKHIFCNCTDAPEKGSFILPANISRGDLHITVSTSGSSPALARKVRRDLEACFGPEYEPFTRLLGTIRQAVLAQGEPSKKNKILFRNLADSALPEFIKNNDREQCAALLKALVPAALHPNIGDWCDECFPTL